MTDKAYVRSTSMIANLFIGPTSEQIKEFAHNEFVETAYMQWLYAHYRTYGVYPPLSTCQKKYKALSRRKQ